MRSLRVVKHACRIGEVAVCAGALLLPITGLAQGVSSNSGAISPQTADAYWTADRLRNAKPLELHPQTGANGLPTAAASAKQSTGKSDSRPGAAPTASDAVGRTLFKPSQSEVQSQDGVEPDATSSYGARYTTARESSPTAYPASTVGKLYFHDPRTGGNFVCSASVLRPRIIMTAGHCIAHPSTSASGRYFYTGHYFVPALSSGYAPYGTWYSSQLWVTNAWYFSNGSVPNAADEGIMIAADRSINGVTRKIASLTGYLGWTTFALSNNNITMKGYPCNLDSCTRMESTNAQTYAAGGNNTYIYGSAMRGGASGGPWIQDYGIAPSSNPAVALGGNYTAGVTSYGPVATAPAYLGASQFDGTFTNLLNAACNSAAGNC